MSTKLVDTECPGCHKKFGTAVDLSEIVVGHIPKEREPEKLPDIDALIEKKLKDREPKQPEKPKKEEITLQSHVPGYKCKNCGDAHPNKGYRKKVKHRCTGDRGDGEECGQYSPDGKGKCPWCGKVDEYEELDDEALENMPQPKEMEHDHEHE